MRGAERIEFALGAFGESGEAATLAQRFDPVAAVGQDLVRVGLMPHIPDQAVARRIEDVVQRDRQFDDPKPRPQMASRDRHCIDGFGAQFVSHLPERILGQAA